MQMDKPKDGCVKPAGGVLAREKQPATVQADLVAREEGRSMLAKVGYEAPDFEATAYFNGEFMNVKLSDRKGKWILLCFYPGDFTFV
jgi:hypothetical protein